MKKLKSKLKKKLENFFSIKITKVKKNGLNSLNLKYCPVCNSKTNFKNFPFEFFFSKYYENQFVYSPFQFETLNLKEYTCTNCNAADRERLIALFLQDYFKKNTQEIKLIDFAPSKPLQQFLREKKTINYRSADFLVDDVDDKVDMRNMTIYDENSFNIFICSHILEHIDDDIMAMKELFRITKPNGIGICLVPILLSLDKSVENKEYLKSEKLRWKHFGQDDHVRMYSKNDFKERLISVGFKLKEYTIGDFGEDVFNNNGLDHRSTLYVVTKPF